MSMRERVLSLLRGEAVSRIRFTAVTTAGPVTISRATFATVATAIDSGKIKITPRAVFDGNVAAEYSPEAVPGGPSGELLVPLLLGRGEEGYAVHECIHAFFDLKSIALNATQEEALAYVVSALYYRMTGLPPTRWDAEPYATAKTAADGLLRRYAVGVAGIPAVDDNAWRSLMLSVGFNEAYFLRRPAGIDRWFIGRDTYIHNG